MQTIDILGWTIKITNAGVSWEGHPRHKDVWVKHFGTNDSTKVLTQNGYGDNQAQGRSQDEEGGIDDERGQDVPHVDGKAELFGPRQSATPGAWPRRA